jgi:hypothetical protein
MNTSNPNLTPRHSRIPFNDHYVRELGAATYIFSYLEWGVVCCIDCLEPGYVSLSNKGTAGNIGDKFNAVVCKSILIPPNVKSDVLAAAKRFSLLVDDRNKLIHGNPYTAATGDQQLLYNGKSGRKEWNVSDIQSVASEFETLAIEVNQLFHDHLKTLRP